MQDYIEKVRQYKAAYPYIVIYGAGRKAIGLYELLQKSNIDIDGFIVTNGTENKKEERGLLVCEVNENRFPPEETLVLIGVRKRWNQEIIGILKKYQYTHYMEAPEGIEYVAEGDLDRSHRTVLQVTLQIGCRIDCKYCPQALFIEKYQSAGNREPVMTLESFKRYIDRTTQDVIIDFAGFSEPFFNKDSIEMMEYAHETGHEVELYTTLVGLEEEGFERIAEIPFREVVLHIPDEAKNSKIPIDDPYRRLLQKVLDTRKADGRPFADWASCHGEIAGEIQEIIAGRLRVITQLHDRAGNLKDGRLEQKHGLRGAITCSNTVAKYHNHNVLLPDGTVLLCDSDWGMKHVLGNLKEKTYEEILAGEESRDIYERRNCEDGDVICRECCYAVKKET